MNAVPIEACEKLLGLKQGHGQLVFADERTRRPDGVVKAQERRVGFETLFGRPREALDDEPGIVVVTTCLPGERPLKRSIIAGAVFFRGFSHETQYSLPPFISLSSAAPK